MKNVTLNQAIEFLSTANPSMFFAINGYENKAGEIANHVIQLNIDRKKLADKALQNLNGLLPKNELSKEAVESLVNSILTPSKARSQGQTNAFIRLNKNTQFCPNTKQISIFGGQRISKTIVKQGTYKTVNSRPLTIEKKRISKSIPYFNPARFNLDTSKFTFAIDGNKLILTAK